MRLSPAAVPDPALDTLTPGRWTEFRWTRQGEVFRPAHGWTVTLAAPALLRITDLWIAGDRFQIAVDDIEALTTSRVDPNVLTGIRDGDSGWMDPRLSKGSIQMAPGMHSLQVCVIEMQQRFRRGGSGAIRIDPIGHVGILEEKA